MASINIAGDRSALERANVGWFCSYLVLVKCKTWRPLHIIKLGKSGAHIGYSHPTDDITIARKPSERFWVTLTRS